MEEYRVAHLVLSILTPGRVGLLVIVVAATAFLQWRLNTHCRESRYDALGMCVGWLQMAAAFFWMEMEGDLVLTPARSWLRVAIAVLSITQIIHNGGVWRILYRQVKVWTLRRWGHISSRFSVF